MSRTIHVCQSIKGALKNWDQRDWADALLDEQGKKIDAVTAKWIFKKLHFEGVKVIPIGKCDNFSDQTGCQGHEVKK